MKLTVLISLFLLVGIYQGQYWKPDGKGNLTHNVQYTDSLRWTPVTVNDLFDYARECYADSTAHTGHFGQGACVGASWGEDDFRCGLSWHHNVTIWTHREESFVGFRKWLQKKIKGDKYPLP
jgi:hypothetical protein